MKNFFLTSPPPPFQFIPAGVHGLALGHMRPSLIPEALAKAVHFLGAGDAGQLLGEMPIGGFEAVHDFFPRSGITNLFRHPLLPSFTKASRTSAWQGFPA